jgi:thioredoxin-like negative regulator of GroEL
VRGIPTLVVLKDGKLEETLVGLAPKEEIARLIEKHL